MKVLQIHNRYRQPGGEDKVVENDAAILTAEGHEVNTFEATNPAGIKAVGALGAAPWNARRTRELSRIVKEWKPDVAHVHNTWFALSPAVVRVLKAEKVPTVVTFHNSRHLCVDGGFFRDGAVCLDCLGELPWRGVARGCYRGSRAQSMVLGSTSVLHRAIGTWSSVDLVTVPSESLKGLYVAGGFDPGRIAVTPWSTTDPGPRLGPPSESDEICFFGRLEAQKGITTLLDAWERAAPALGELRLKVVGSGDLETTVRKTIQRLGGRVEHHHWMSPQDVARTMLTARAVVVPSLCLEVFGFVAIEAMAAGVPVVASNRGALPETVGKIDPDLLVGPEDESGWAAALAGLTDDGAIDEFGRRGREIYESSYTPEHGRDRLLETYARVLASRS